MANTYTQILIHIVFAVKGRSNLISSKNKDELYKYISGIVQNKAHKLLIINGMPDHIHILLGLNPSESISNLVKEIKRMSSKFINERNWVKGKFEWQSGYSAFSYSKSHLNNIYKYIENQEIHHKKRTFREEYLELLKKFQIKYDKQYIFKDVENI